MKFINNIKIIFYILILIANYWIYSIIIELQEQKNCLCNSGWRIENIKMISILTIGISLINIFIPLNKALYKIPVISTVITFGVVLVIFSQLFLVVRLSRQLNTAKCQDTCNINPVFSNIRNLSLGTLFIISLVLSVGFLYL
jgi:putative Mn2+ efflux pump MntP